MTAKLFKVGAWLGFIFNRDVMEGVGVIPAERSEQQLDHTQVLEDRRRIYAAGTQDGILRTFNFIAEN